MNKKQFTLLSLSIMATYYVAQALIPFAYAQESVRNFTIVPPTVEQTVNPGDKAEGILKVVNDGETPLRFSVGVQDYVVTDTKGTPNLLPSDVLSKKYSAASWLAVTPNNFTLAPHQKELLNYYLQIPSDARPGGHYAAVVYNPATADSINGNGASVNTIAGSLFYITVKGNVNEFAQVTKFLASSFQEYGPEKIALQIKNYGDLHEAPKGNITVTDIFGRKIQSVPLDQHNIFPGAARDFQATLGQQWMVGKFTANLLASYGANSNLPLVASVTFWIFPWRVATIVVLIILAAILALLLWRKRKHDRQLEESTNSDLPTKSASVDKV